MFPQRLAATTPVFPFFQGPINVISAAPLNPFGPASFPQQVMMSSSSASMLPSSSSFPTWTGTPIMTANPLLNNVHQTALWFSQLNQDRQNSGERMEPTSIGANSEGGASSREDSPSSPNKQNIPGNVPKAQVSIASMASTASRKRSRKNEQEPQEEDSKASRRGGDSPVEMPKASSLRGEKRLVIAFEALGTRGQYPQTFGKSGALIPHGIIGTHTVYNERWRFEILHASEVFEVDRLKCVCLTWKVTNLATGTTTSITETRDEAAIRNSQGQTISNKVFREALEARAKDLEKHLETETNTKRIAQLQSLIRALRPKRFSEGPLIFGLQHRVVQEKMQQTN